MAPVAPDAQEDDLMQTALIVFAAVSCAGILGSALVIAWRSACQDSRG
jgi:hypothetical protein